MIGFDYLRQLFFTASTFMSYELAGHPLWSYLGYLLWLFGGWHLTFWVRGYLEQSMKRWLCKHTSSLSGRLIERLILPLVAGMLFTLVFGGLRLFDLAGEHNTWHLQVYTLAIGVCLSIAMVRLTEVFLWRWKSNYRIRHHEELNVQLYMLVDKGAQLFIILTMSMMTLHNMGINITSLLASLSIGSLAIALAAQDTLSNLFGAVSILVDNSFKIGDRIRVDAIEGIVEEIGLRSTRVRNMEGVLVTIPNKSIGTAVIINISDRSAWKATWNLDLAYETTRDQLVKACEIINKIYSSDLRTKEVTVGFKQFHEKGLRIEISHALMMANYRQYLEAVHQINLLIKQELDREKIELQLPSSVIRIEKSL